MAFNGKEFAKLRRLTCHTQVELSKKIEQSDDFIGLVESGKQDLSLSILNKIAEVLGVPPGWIILLYDDLDKEKYHDKIYRINNLIREQLGKELIWYFIKTVKSDEQ